MKKFSDWNALERYLDELGLFRMKPGQERITAVLESLGLKRPPYLLIQGVGTNGKGSTCAFLSSLARSHGFSCGLHTSPHFVSMRERIRILRPDIAVSVVDATSITPESKQQRSPISDPFCPVAQTPGHHGGSMFSEREWLDGVNRIMEHGGETLTYFELITVLAVLLFEQAGVDLAVMETGLGGRFDATTALDADLVFFSPIDLDHAEVLGPSLRDIAKDKAGAMRAGVPAISAAQKPEVRRELEAAAGGLGVELTFSQGQKILPEAMQPKAAPFLLHQHHGQNGALQHEAGQGIAGQDGAHLDATHPDQLRHAHELPAPKARIPLGLPGKHQYENAALAVKVWRAVWPTLSAGKHPTPYPAERTARLEIEGLAKAWIPGRLQFIEASGLGQAGSIKPQTEADTISANSRGAGKIISPVGCRAESCPSEAFHPPHPPHPPIMLDGAHNPHGMAALGHSLALMGIAPPVTIFSCLADKQPEKLVPHLRVLSSGLIIVPQIQNHPRAMDARELAELIGRSAIAVENITQALHLATDSIMERLPEIAGQSIDECRYPLLICGSLYLLAEFYRLYPEYLE